MATGNNLYVPCIKSRATNERTNERTIALATTNGSRERVSRYRPVAPLLCSAPLHAAWYLGRGWPLVRLPKTFLFFPLRASETPARRNSRETTATRIARQPARNWFHPEKSHWVTSKRGAFRAFKTGSIRVRPFEETDIFAERTNDTIRRDATRRASTMVSGFRARGGIDRTRARTSPSDLFKVQYDRHTGPRVHFIYDDETKPRRARTPAVVDRLRKKGISR